MKLASLLLPSLMVFLSLVSNISVFRLKEKSVESLKLWQEGELDSVVLKLDEGQGVSSIYLTKFLTVPSSGENAVGRIGNFVIFMPTLLS